MADGDVRTFRGRSVEELIPKIREELGPDAIVLRSREALEGGIGGFFQRPLVEIEARPPLPHERSDDVGAPLLRDDRATAEGLASPAVAHLVDQAQPFADELARAQRDAAARAQELLAAHAEALVPAFEAETFEAAPAAAGLYGPQPNLRAVEEAAPAVTPAAAPGPAAPAAPAQAAPAPPPSATTELPSAAQGALPAPRTRPLAAPAPPAAGELERALVASGLSADLAADVVGEAVGHHLPFAAPRQLPQLVRRVLASRIPVLSDLGAAPRAIAFAGTGGAGKTAAAANLAVAYAAAGARVAVFALGAAEDRRPLAARLEPLGIPVHGATDPAAARAILDRLHPDLAVFDTPALGPGDAAAIRALAAQLRLLALDEVHLALPAPMSGAAAAEAHRALQPLGITHAALTHADSTEHPGAAIEAALSARLPISYVCARATVQPADADDLAGRLL